MNFSIVFDNIRLFLWTNGTATTGLLLTIELLAVSVISGLLLALPLAVMRASRNRWLSEPVRLFTYVFRGTPLLVQMYVIYYGLAEVDLVRQSWLWVFLREAYICAWLAFGLNTAAYTCEIIAGALRTTAAGELEAAAAFGMSRWIRLRFVLLPGALRRALPAYSNEVIFTLHGTALASGVTLLDLAGTARAVSMRYAAPYEPYIAALVLYGLCTIVLLQMFRFAERRWLAHLRPRQTSGSRDSQLRTRLTNGNGGTMLSTTSIIAEEGSDVRS